MGDEKGKLALFENKENEAYNKEEQSSKLNKCVRIETS